MVRPFLSSVAWSEAASAPSGETEDQDELDGHEALPTVDRSGAQHGFIADGRGSTGPRTPGPHKLEKTLLPPNAALCLEFTTELQIATRLRVGGKLRATYMLPER